MSVSSSYQVEFPNTFSDSCTVSTTLTADGICEVVRFGDILWDLVDAVCKISAYDDICRTPVFLHISSVFLDHPHARYGMSLSSLMEDNFDKTAISWNCLESSGGTYLPAEDMVVFPTFNDFFRGVLDLVEEIANFFPLPSISTAFPIDGKKMVVQLSALNETGARDQETRVLCSVSSPMTQLLVNLCMRATCMRNSGSGRSFFM
eukprot:gene10913-17032_t